MDCGPSVRCGQIQVVHFRFLSSRLDKGSFLSFPVSGEPDAGRDYVLVLTAVYRRQLFEFIYVFFFVTTATCTTTVMFGTLGVDRVS
jgi:hypothetical protein